MIRRVLVAVDDSPRAATVFAKGLEIARSARSSVLVYHAVSIPPRVPSCRCDPGR